MRIDTALRTVLLMAHNDLTYGPRVRRSSDADAIAKVRAWLEQGRASQNAKITKRLNSFSKKESA